MKLNAQQICRACNGKFLVYPMDTTIFAVAVKIDSRDVECGDLFIAFKGNTVDGHNYISDVIKNKASIVICEKPLSDKLIKLAEDNLVSVIQVENSQTALQNIAIEWRKDLIGKVIGITGSVGKTTVKKIINGVLSLKYNVCANKGNFNNEIGLPITLCSAEVNDDFIITEMGMSSPGEITDLCKIAQPSWGLITNISEAHLEFFNSIDDIAKAKSELALSIPDNVGIMFLPMDSIYRDFVIDYAKLRDRGIRIIFFGGNSYHKEFSEAQIWYENVEIDESGRPSFTICTKGFKNLEDEKAKCKLNICGKHNIVNACGAIAVALEADIKLPDIIEYLKTAMPENGRQEILKAKSGYTIINDAYNANPTSTTSSVETFAYFKSNGKKIAFLGDMFELGTYEVEGHKKVGVAVANNNIDELICVGDISINIATSAISAGMSEDKVHHFTNKEDAIKHLKSIISKDDIVLFKASNGMGFQKIVKDLIN